MTTQDHVARIVALRRDGAGECTRLANLKAKRSRIAKRATDKQRKAADIRETINAGVAEAVLEERPFTIPASETRALREAEAEARAQNEALPVIDAEIAAAEGSIRENERQTNRAAFDWTSSLQAEAAEAIQTLLGSPELQAQLGHLIAIDRLRERHCTGVIGGLPAGGDRPWQSTQVVANFLRGLPQQLRPKNLTLEVIQREALATANDLESIFSEEGK